MRYLLLDKITVLETSDTSKRRAVGIKCVTLSEDVFTDHFPGYPVMPGAMIIEAMAQLGGTLLEAIAREDGHGELYAVLAMVERVKFRHPVRPGERLELEATVQSASDAGGRVRVTVTSDDRKVTEGELGFALFAIDNERVIAQRKEMLEVWRS